MRAFSAGIPLGLIDVILFSSIVYWVAGAAHIPFLIYAEYTI